MRKVLTILLMVALILGFTGCGAKKDGGADMFKPGTYNGAAPGVHKDDVKVKVTFDSKSIKKIEIVEHNETPGLSDAAFERIPAAIIEGQTLAVDTIAGATFSSRAIIEAVTAAVEKAGGDVEALANKAVAADTERGETVEYSVDVVVIGSGGAGLAAAVSAHQNGATVMVVEKMPNIGGNTILSGSAFNCVDPSRQEPLGIEDSVEKHYTQTFEGGTGWENRR